MDYSADDKILEGPGTGFSTKPRAKSQNVKELLYLNLVEEHYQSLYRYAFWLAKNKAIAEDIVQETFLRAWRSLDSLQSETSAKPWLFTILRRENYRLYSRNRPEMTMLDEQHIEDSSQDEPGDMMDKQLLYKAIMDLKAEYRDPLLLQIIGGFSSQEIAAILALKPSTVLTRLFRARNRLNEKFLHKEAFDEVEFAFDTEDA